MQKIIVTCIAVVIGIVLLTMQLTPSVPKVETSPIPVLAATPAIKDITSYLESLGTLHPSVYMEIRPQADGVLSKVFVHEGDWVQEGTPLFEVDCQSYLIRVQEAEAQLAIDRANFQATQKKLDRFRELAEKDLLAQTEWDDLEAAAAKGQATIDLDGARLAAAKLHLEDCTVRSPVEGRVGKLDAHPGHLVSKGQPKPLATVAKMDPLIVEFTVTEKEFPKIGRNLPHIEMQSLCTGCGWRTAAVTFLDNHFDSKTGLLLVRGRVDNADKSLRPGQSVRIRMPIAVRASAKLLPQKAIRYNPQGPYVYVVQEDMTVAFRQLVLGEEQGIDVEVIEGVASDEQIIIDGHLRLAPGLKVEVKT